MAITIHTDGCEGPELGPWTPENRPALPSLAYRLSTYGTFLRRMIARLPDVRFEIDIPGGGSREVTPLLKLTTRDPDDPTLALLDAWAVVADVLTFYQERIANEGYLRTATERRSVLEMARAIGYELKPGVAASTHLAFTLDDTDTAPETVVIEAGVQVKSIPEPGQLPQTFETLVGFEGDAAWNALRPRLTQEQSLDEDLSTRFLEGIDTTLEAGDWLLLVREQNGLGEPQADPEVVQILDVTPEPALQRTRLDLDLAPKAQTFFKFPVVATLPLLKWKRKVLNKTNLAADVTSKAWRGRDLSAFLKVQGWRRRAVVRHINFRRKIRRRVRKFQAANDPLPFEPGLYAFREKVGVFGHNAPRWASLPASQRLKAKSDDDPPVYEKDWDTAPPAITQTSQKDDYLNADFYLERVVEGVVSQGWVLLQSGTGAPEPFQIAETVETSLSDYGISGKTTGLEVQKADGQPGTLTNFKFRTTTVYTASERLPLATLPIEEDLGEGTLEEDQITLNETVLGLTVGQDVILAGERADLPGVEAAEVLTLKDIFHEDGLTTLRFTTAISHPYVRSTVAINANVVEATHGETVAGEVLGSGDATQPFQRFPLKKPPLTYVSSASASGAESTLTVRVNGVAWEEVERFFGQQPEAQVYTIRHEDDGTIYLVFGDGEQGARLPTGQENVTATYRSGIGLDGNVAEERLTLLAKRPLGVREVTNPVAASGAAAPESLADARLNAPRTVLTFDRIVSLRDFEDFARSFAGIGRAQALALWDGQTRVVYLTIADEEGQAVAQTSKLYTNLRAAIDAVRDPGQHVRIEDFELQLFNLNALLRIDRRYVKEAVQATVDEALRAAFSFEARAFGQPVTAAEVVALIQRHEGVVAVDLNQLYLADDESGPSQTFPASVLPARNARWDGTQILKTQQIQINPAGIELTTEFA